MSRFLADPQRYRAFIMLPLDEKLILARSLAHVRLHAMKPWGLHGVAHWWRVRHNGLLVAAHSGANERVVRLFALIHDSFREDDGSDPQHGARAAAWLLRVREDRVLRDEVHDEMHAEPHTNDAAFQHTRAVIHALDARAFEQLHRACELHTSTARTGDLTIDACFVADRLDLARVGYRPDPRLMPADASLLTPTFIDDAMQRTHLGLSWANEAEFTEAWGVAIPQSRPH